MPQPLPHNLLYALCVLCGLTFCPTNASHSIAQEPQTATKEKTSFEQDRPGWYLGRQIAPTMSASGADWLIRKSREQEEQPRKLLKALQVKPGQKVCDFGCGNGFYSLQLAERVGPRGKVFAIDIQQEMLDLLQQRAQPRGFANIESVLATPTDPKLPTEKLDLILMVDVYHELSEPALILQAMHRSLSSTGRLVLVEFREEDPKVPISRLHKMSQVQVMKEVTANDFKLVGQFDELPWQHVLFFARQDASLSKRALVTWQPVPAASSRQQKSPSDSGDPQIECSESNVSP